jgi:predicted DNA-binding protein (UPF0251 family)
MHTIHKTEIVVIRGGLEMAKGKWDTVKNRLVEVEAWARDGLTDKQIAENLGISRDTLYVYKKEHSDISDALGKGKEVADIIMENAAYKRGTGYTYDEITTEITTTTTGKELARKVKKVTKHVPGDPSTQQWWLSNRKPDTWRQHQREQAGSDEGMMPEYISLLKSRYKKDA